MLVRILYSSLVCPGVSAADVDRLVGSAQRRNRQLDLTGALTICDGHFVQILEGRESAVDEMMKKIALDLRHHGLKVHDRQTVSKRLFATWDMALISASRCLADVRNLVGGRMTPDAFASSMVAWLDEKKHRPF